jgi:hypothetical protein
MIILIVNPNDLTDKLLELIREFSKSLNIKPQYLKIQYFISATIENEINIKYLTINLIKGVQA